MSKTFKKQHYASKKVSRFEVSFSLLLDGSCLHEVIPQSTPHRAGLEFMIVFLEGLPYTSLPYTASGLEVCKIK